jgi:hypothetical protein
MGSVMGSGVFGVCGGGVKLSKWAEFCVWGGGVVIL